MPYQEVLIPFDLASHELVLDPTSRGRSLAEAQAAIDRTIVSSPWLDSAMLHERVSRAAVCLFAANAGTWSECLDTALVWEVG